MVNLLKLEEKKRLASKVRIISVLTTVSAWNMPRITHLKSLSQNFISKLYINN